MRAPIVFSLLFACACGAPFEGAREVKDPLPEAGSQPETSTRPDSDSHSEGGREAAARDHSAPEAAPKEAGSKDAAPEAAPPPKDSGPALGNACAVMVGATEYDVAVAPSCPSTYSVDYVPSCATFGTCSCTSCAIIADDPVQPCTETYPGDVSSPLSCAVGSACTVNAPTGLEAIPAGSMLSGKCVSSSTPIGG